MIDFGTLRAELDPVRIGKFWYVRVIDAAKLLAIAYARVSSRGQRAALDRKKLRLLEDVPRRRLPIDQVIAEVGSGLDATRPKLLKALSRPQLRFIVVEHRERLARFGFEMVHAVLRAQGGAVLVLEERKVDDELVCDMIEVLTGFCARLHGRRSAERRARKAMEAARP